MFADPFYNIAHGEIFKKSFRIQKEHIVANFFSGILLSLGYTTTDLARRRWQRDNKTVIVCLADDFNICGADRSKPPMEWYDTNTIVITDNYIKFRPQYNVIRLPTSYFGIFNYTPENQEYTPTRRFNFSVNRLDSQRELVLAELINQTIDLANVLQQDYINFNCWDPLGANDTADNLESNFLKYWSQLSEIDPLIYTPIMEQIVGAIPIRNHSLSVEQAHVGAWVVPVVETYSGNVTIAFSEKLFRALVTPVPWTLYTTTGAVDHLRTLGFDVLDDLIDHSYNNVAQTNLHGLKKIKAFISTSIDSYNQLKTGNFEQITTRCLQAAHHNQQLLSQWEKQWPKDFANWLPNVVDQLI